MLKLAVLSIAVFMMATAEPPLNGGYIVGGPSSGGYQRAPQQHHSPLRVKYAGPSKIFGWLGSKFPKIPYFLPRFPNFPKYKPQNNLPNYQVILPQPPKVHGYGSKPQAIPEKVQIFGPTYVSSSPGQNHYSAPAPVVSYQPVAQQQQFRPNVEVFPSQLLSYENEVVSGGPQQQQQHQQQQQAYYQPSPVSSPPLLGGGKYQIQSSQVPVVPQSNGPDYFNTAYTQEGQQYQTQYSSVDPQQQYTIQNVDSSDNYGATFGNIQVQPAQSQTTPQIYDASLDLRAVGGPVIDSSSQQQQEQSYMDGSAVAGQDASLSSIISSLTDSAGLGQSDYQQQNTAYSQLSVSTVQPQQHQQQQQQSQQQYHQQVQYQQQQQQQPQQQYQQQQQQPQQQQYQQQEQQQQQYQVQEQQTQQSQQTPIRVTSPYSRVGGQRGQELVPGVQLLSQGTNDGNPVFEVVADANAPTFNGHPFDINKLIEMIEPGAQLDSAPQLSEASSENKETYVEAPTPAVSIPQNYEQQQSSSSGTGDLHFSESDPQPSITNLDGTRISAMPSHLSPDDDDDDNADDTVDDVSLINDNDENNNDSSSNSSSSNVYDSSSSLMQLMEFFQQTGGKGYVVVEKTRSNLTLPNTNDTDSLTVDLDDDDELTDGPSRLNITSETIPQLEIQQNINKLNLIDPTYPKKAGFSSINTKSTNSSSSSNNSTTNSFVKLPNSTYLTPTSPAPSRGIVLSTRQSQSIPAVVFPTRKSKPYVNTRTPPAPPSQSVSATSPTKINPPKLAFKPNYVLPPTTATEHPNHNYNATPSTTSSDLPLLGNIPGLSDTNLEKINPLVDSVADLDNDDELYLTDDMIETEGDLALSESQQVKSIAITVTPPPHILNTTPVPSTSNVENSQNSSSTTQIPEIVSIPGSTQKSVLSKSGKSVAMKPFPVYRGKTN